MLNRIKSFSTRSNRRISNRQFQALNRLLCFYKLDLNYEKWDFYSIFNRKTDTVIEIGFGMGDFLLFAAEKNLNLNFIGIDVYNPGIGNILASIEDRNIKNIRVAPYDAVDVFQYQIKDKSLMGVQIFFPDPWPKRKHHKRRLIQFNFVKSLISKIRDYGFLFCITDCKSYANSMRSIFNSYSSLKPINDNYINNIENNYLFFLNSNERPLTKFERRSKKLFLPIWKLIYLVI
ncbi:tRNA (guanosine(46)-N7)-methyltransferase TrmB [Candidatus Legionella polyplacis]|uniref:tRNA (guanine-N(7)-)-methyltransferase n=1 Tax=Candidatus Legionella polyplacis TaxID=2005262 RepID=A0ABZ2GWF2_9GAMM